MGPPPPDVLFDEVGSGVERRAHGRAGQNNPRSELKKARKLGS